MMNVIEKDKTIAVVLNENDELKIMPSKIDGDSYIITCKNGVLIIKKEKVEKR
jgi:hypothetical protein